MPPTRSDDGFDESAQPCPVEARGEAALLLVESLIHALVARSGLSLGEAIEIVEIATEAQTGLCDERREPEGQRSAVTYLKAIAASLRIDAPATAKRSESAANDGQSGPA